MILLCILDGFGLRDEVEDNAIKAARTPNFDSLWKKYPHTKLDASGRPVGLPDGQMGNSEVGHLNLGAGRIVYQDVSRIDKAVEDGEFAINPVLRGSMQETIARKKAIHLLGLVSDGCVHSSMVHLDALIKMAAELNAPELYLHAFLDGRDTSPKSGAGYMQQVLDMFNRHGVGQVATLMGRYWGMDRDKRWDRNERAYAAIVYGEGAAADDPVAAIRASYEKDITDEFVEPVVFNAEGEGQLKNGDLALFFNFRADRVRQLNHLFEGNQKLSTIKDRHAPEGLSVNLVNMTSYDEKLKTPRIAFPPIKLKNIFGRVISKAGKKQLRIAETEKYAHVTYFFNGGDETPFEGEDRILVQSPKVATYDLQPEMSAPEVTEKVIGAIENEKYDVIVLNFANCDMVGHTGFWDAAIIAVETVDNSIGRVMEAVSSVSGTAILTADHGNVELMKDYENGGPHTAHTTNKVPCILINGPMGRKLKDGGKLADIAPTILELLKLEKPIEMTGESLLL